MSGSQLLVGFYVPRAAAASFDDACARLATDGSAFGPLPAVAVSGETTPDHHLVELYFPERDFLTLRDAHPAGGELPIEDDGAVALAHAVRTAASRVGAVAAVVITHPYQATPAWLREHEWMVIAGDADALAREFVGMLWMADAPTGEWMPSQPTEGRDELSTGPGRTIFAGRGWARWS